MKPVVKQKLSTLQDIINNAQSGGGGTVDAYTKAEADAKFETITDAASTYLSKSDAASTYVSSSRRFDFDQIYDAIIFNSQIAIGFYILYLEVVNATDNKSYSDFVMFNWTGTINTSSAWFNNGSLIKLKNLGLDAETSTAYIYYQNTTSDYAYVNEVHDIKIR